MSFLFSISHVLTAYRTNGSSSEEIVKVQNAMLAAEKAEEDRRNAEKKKSDISDGYLNRCWLPPCKY